MVDRRLDRVVDPDFATDLSSRSDDELHAMKAEALEVETEVSYVRRLAQGRIDIMRAEQRRRSAGESVGDLVAALPQILADEGRPGPGRARLNAILAPSPAIAWGRGLEKLIDDGSLARLPDLGDAELDDVLSRLRQLEQDVSTTRHSIHEAIDAIDAELGSRLSHD